MDLFFQYHLTFLFLILPYYNAPNESFIEIVNERKYKDRNKTLDELIKATFIQVIIN